MDDGYLCRSRKSNFPLVQNTTAFDIIFYLMCCRIVDEETFKTVVLQRCDEDFRNLIMIYLEKGSHQSTYLARNKVIMKHFDQENVRGMKVLDCQSTVVEICHKVFTKIFPVKIETSCKCKLSRKETQLSVLDGNLNNGVNLDELSPVVCKKCDQLQSMAIDLNGFIFIDMKNLEMMFEKIQQTILIQDKLCILFAVVQTASRNNKPYYIFHVRRSNQEWYTFDKTFKKTPFNMKEIKCELLIYTCRFAEKKAKKKFVKTKSFEIIENFHAQIINGIKINVNNACGPDSILHVLCNIYSEIDMQKNQENNSLTSLIRAYMDGNENEVYYYRALLLLELKYDISVVNFSEIRIDCATNIYNALDSICSDHFPSMVTIKKCDCELAKRNITAIEIDFQKLAHQGIKKLSSCILLPEIKSRSTCLRCKKGIEVKQEISNIIFIDIQPMQTCEKESYEIGNITLRQIPQIINIGNNSFDLKAAIEYQPNEGGLSHYVVHSFKKNKWLVYNDLCKKSSESDMDKKITVHMLAYINVKNNPCNKTLKNVLN